MNYVHPIFSWRGILLFFVGSFLLLASACRPTSASILSSDDFTKDKRELLGQTIVDAILQSPDRFPLFENNTSESEIIHQHLQQLYTQASFFIQNDAFASSSNKWDITDKWEIHILQSDEKLAFCVPGGDFFISTALLKSIEFEYELYYIMSFEIVLMNDRHLLNKLISFAANPDQLVEIADTGQSTNGVTALMLAEALARIFVYDDDNLIKTIDQETIFRICESSSIDRRGIIPLLNTLSIEDQWLTTRPSFSSRKQYHSSSSVVENADRCGTEKWTNKGRIFYEEKIANKLP